MSELYKVYFLSSNVHSCFFYLNDSDLRNANANKLAIKIIYGPDHQNTTFGSISSAHLAEVPHKHIGVSSLFGSKLGLKENEVIIVSYCDVNSIDTLEISPKKEEDYVILLSCKSILETYLLNQLSVVAEGQVLPVYVFSNISIDIEIGKLNLSSGYGQLQKYTKITVLHPSENLKNITNAECEFPTEGNTAEGRQNFIKIIFSNLHNNLGSKIGALEIDKQRNQDLSLKNLMKRNQKDYEGLEFKITSHFMLNCNLPEKFQNTFIIVSNLEIKNTFGPHSVKILARIEKASSSANVQIENIDEVIQESPFLNAHVISLNNSNDDNFAFCPPYVMKKLELYVGSRITIKQLKPKENKAEKIQPVINRESKFSDNSLWKSVAEIKENVKQTITNNFKYNYKINILIVGEPGTGKTFLLTDIINEFMSEFIYCKVIQCKSLRGKKIETLYQLFINNLKDCICQEPSILVFDDLHALTYIVEEEDQFNKLYSNRIVDLISATLDNFQRNYNITVIASASGFAQLSSFISRNGPRLFQDVIQIPEMKHSERDFALRNIIKCKVGNPPNSSLDLDKLSSSTNGHTIQNLVDVVDKAVFNCLLRNETENLSNISQIDFELALTESVPFKLKCVKSKQNFDNKWDDVGGMMEPKKILTEVFSWPLKYPDLLESCPLRLQRGVLLYGAPGTGKTLLAGALANKCGLNFISVKGPEILSKYVGASEEGLRSLFVQAQKSRPCLLFFDEFDSLAPKRGHESSGVTDRVVNQMLTQLDGVESLNGVWVLAATSRPDLLDPALLRPGRLDKLVFCDVPNKGDRLSILKILSKNLPKGEDVNLSEIAEKAEGYTGADLQALLYNAQMSAIKEVKSSLEKATDVKVVQLHFLKAFSEVKPSMSRMEKKRYDKIYEKFLNSRKRQKPKSYVGMQKVTLA